MEPTSPATALLLPATIFVPFSGSSARAYLGIGLAVLEGKRRLLLHSPVAGGVVDNTVLIVGVGSTWRR
jgi:hypothetical protein